ncbi:MAG: DNA-formamidopyrimidine glycosylase [Candidatus Caldatribacteriaceae bacterium]
MPELPEVETIRTRLQEYVEGATILSIEDPEGRFALPAIVRRRVERLFRHGKCLFFEFPKKDALLIHLGMTGKLLLSVTRETFPYQRLIFHFTSGLFLSFCDQRRFGRVKYLTAGEKQVFLGTLGIDPFSPAYRLEHIIPLLASQKRVKDFLLDQRKIAGIGNIYASEILFRSGIHPERKLSSLSPQERCLLFAAIPSVLEEAVQCQGTTIRDFAGADGRNGRFQECLAVYGRAGKPCLCCGTPIERKVIGSRSTYFCPTCQQ